MRRRTDIPPGRGAFALPLVVLLSLVVSIAVTVMLERQAAQRLVVQRQLEDYQRRHAERGLRELADGWRESATPDALSEFVASGPREVMRVDLDDGSLITLVVGVKQSRLGTAVAGDGPEAFAAMRALAWLEDEAKNKGGRDLGPKLLERWVRTVGPLQASLDNAEPEVIEGVAHGVCYVDGLPDDELADALTSELMRLRRSTRRNENGGEAALREAAAAAGLDGEATQALTRLLTTTPSVYEARVELWPRNTRPGGAARPLARYIGLFEVGSGSRGQQQLSARSAFLTWEDRTPEPAVSGKPDEWALDRAFARGAYGG